MKKFRIITAASVIALLSGCQAETLPQENLQHPEIDAPASAVVEGLIRIQVSEKQAELWLSSADEAGSVSAFDKTMFDGLDVISVSTSFNIGGKYIERQKKAGLHLWFDVRYNESVPTTKASEQMLSSAEIRLAEPVYKMKPMQVQMNDPEFTKFQWHYNNVGEYGFRPGIDIGLVEAWNKFGVFGNREVIIAVVDSGVEFSHEDLNPNMWVNEAELNGVEGVDDDGNGYKDDVYGYNFVGGSAKINFDSHGTHVAGTIAAVNNNGIGVCGVAGGYYPDKPGVRVMTLQVIDDNYPDASASLPRVYQYAAENGAVILNNSWGYAQTLKVMPTADKQAIDYFVENAGIDQNGNQTGPMKGGLAIFAAGNESEDLAYPAAYEKVLAVAALGPKGEAAYYTNYGDWVDVCAPGGDHKVDRQYGGIYSIGLNNTYNSQQGTSMACPHVTGIAGLVLSACGGPGYTRDDLWNAIIEGTDPSVYDYNPDMIGMLGVGMVNASLALSTLNTTAPEDVTTLSAESNANTVYLTADVPADDTGDAYYYHVYVSEKAFDASDLASMQSIDIAINKEQLLDNGLRRFALKGLKFETEYHIAVIAGDFAGNRSSVPCMTTVSTKANTLPQITVTREGKKELLSSESTSYVFIASDSDDFHVVTCSFDAGNTTGVTFETLIDGSYHVKIDGSKMKEGAYNCRFIAADQFGGKSVYEIRFIINTNSAPVATAAMSPVVLKGVGESDVVDLAYHFNDPDGDNLSYTVAVADKSVVTTSISNNKLTVTGTAIGKTQIKITATDPSGETASADLSVVVRDAAKPFDLYPNPVIDVLNVGAGEECHGSITIYSSTGKKAYEADQAAMSPFTPFKADLSALAPGVYSIVIKTPGNSDYKTEIVKL